MNRISIDTLSQRAALIEATLKVVQDDREEIKFSIQEIKTDYRQLIISNQNLMIAIARLDGTIKESNTQQEDANQRDRRLQ